MSRQRRRRREAPRPPSSAGLFRFFEESTESIIKIRPEIIVIMAGIFIIAAVLVNLFLTL